MSLNIYEYFNIKKAEGNRVTIWNKIEYEIEANNKQESNEIKEAGNNIFLIGNKKGNWTENYCGTMLHKLSKIYKENETRKLEGICATSDIIEGELARKLHKKAQNRKKIELSMKLSKLRV